MNDDVVVTSADPSLHARLESLARSARMVYFAGLPGTGKSLMMQQLAHVAAAGGRVVHALQWDVARPVFEGSDAGQRYPVVDGVTHAMVRKAVGLWARRAIAEWAERFHEPAHLLVGETPFVGGRLIELAREGRDSAESLLVAEACRFVIPVPSRAIREFLEAERERRAVRPVHAREREDAPPHVLRDIWREVLEAGRELGFAATDAAYDPEVYARVYESVLRGRHVERLPIDVRLPVEGRSAYEFTVPLQELIPDTNEATAVLEETEARYRDARALELEVRHWFVA
jgi:hypothetical protein